MNRYFLAFLSAAVANCGIFAQDINYKQQAASGYKGGYIKNLKLQAHALDFIVVGDWGRQGEYHQKAVAQQMNNAAVSLDLDFVISTGDNFYPDGVASIQDPLWNSSFEQVYHHFSLQKNWYSVLGNHDYRSNPDAQLAYSQVSHRWTMPARYFFKKMLIDDDTSEQVLFVFIDTSPFVKKYHKDEVYGPQVIKQDTLAQKRWLDSVLSNAAKSIKWKIVVGHHPAYTGGKRKLAKDTEDILNSFKSIFDKHQVDVVLSGHEHHLEHTKPPGATHYFISGAGSEVRPAAKYPVFGKFAASTPGFFTFSITATQILVHTINASGNIIYATSISK